MQTKKKKIKKMFGLQNRDRKYEQRIFFNLLIKKIFQGRVTENLV